VIIVGVMEIRLEPDAAKRVGTIYGANSFGI
jgi:hypothetical protein